MIKDFFFLFFILFFSNISFSQNYDSVDSIVDSYAKDLTSADKIAELINRDFTNQSDKARAIFRWVATNISYDVDLSELMDSKVIKAYSYKNEKERVANEKKFKSDLVISTLNTKKAVCHGYAILIEYLCQKSGIEVKTILGNLKSDPSQIGILPNSINHAWNVVKIDGKWQFIDATLASGFISDKTNAFKFYFNDGYFFTTPDLFFLNHYPSDESWLLTKKDKIEYSQLPLFFGYYIQNKYKITKQEKGLFSISKNGNFNFKIEGLSPDDRVEYSLSSVNKLTYLEQDEITKEFSINLNKGGAEEYLFIYINRKIMALYKILN